MPISFAAADADATPLVCLHPDEVDAWAEDQPAFLQAQLAAQPFAAGVGEVRCLVGTDGAVAVALAGLGTDATRARHQYPLGGLSGKLSAGTYAIANALPPDLAANIALSFLLSSYRFDRYKTATAAKAHLVAPDGVDAARLQAEAASVALTCDLINTPANDMGPDALEAAFLEQAQAFGATATVIRGAELLAQNFPLIHAVGRASDQEPRLLEMVWGDEGAPRVTLVGKGVCFDTGGLNLKPGASMGLMKKDMGGAATVLGLSQLIMSQRLPVRLRVLIPAVENSVSAGAFRPGDVLTARNGLTVEVNNTDAEGRLVLADALALAGEDAPEITITMATLTGAARVALGPDLPPFFTGDEALAGEISAAAARVWDPLWRMPFWEPYEEMIEPDIADLDNAPKGGFAGAITAALFLRRFAPTSGAYVHFDCYGWTPTAKPGRPKGGASQGARALFDVFSRRYGG